MSTESLNWIIHCMKANFGFDAMQILWFCPENKKHYELFREGYNKSCADSLNYDFPMTYPQGFTHLISPHDLLPPSISESGEIMQPPFRMTNIYLNALNKHGYCDGLSLELNSSEFYFGLIHFSSYAANNFNRNVRTLIHNFRTVIEDWMGKMISYNKTINNFIFFYAKQKSTDYFELIKGDKDKIQSEVVFNIVETLEENKQQLLLNQQNVYTASITCFPNGSNIIEVVPAALPNKLTKKELLVLSWLVSGKTDKEISQCLCLGERTINSHIASILRKLEVNNRVEAAVYAVLNQVVFIQNGMKTITAKSNVTNKMRLPNQQGQSID